MGGHWVRRIPRLAGSPRIVILPVVTSHALTCDLSKTGPCFREATGVGKSSCRLIQLDTADARIFAMSAISETPTNSGLGMVGCRDHFFDGGVQHDGKVACQNIGVPK